jgi:hypothetical protein
MKVYLFSDKVIRLVVLMFFLSSIITYGQTENIMQNSINTGRLAAVLNIQIHKAL